MVLGFVLSTNKKIPLGSKIEGDTIFKAVQYTRLYIEFWNNINISFKINHVL